MLGGGTNMLVSDLGVRGVVLQNDWSETSVDGTTIAAASGTPLASVAAVAARSGIVGLEWMATVPGTVGGAVHGNAGAFGSETKDVLMPAVTTCRDCHQPKGGARSGCVECHRYHDKSKERDADGPFKVPQLLSGVGRNRGDRVR